MKTMNIKLFSCIKGFLSLLLGLLLRLCSKKSKLKVEDVENKPISIQVENGGQPGNCYPEPNIYPSHLNKSANKDDLVAWSEWNDQFDSSAVAETNYGEQDSCNIELFKDMEPVISKPKVVRLKQKNIDDAVNIAKNNISNKFGIEGNTFSIESELGTWEDEPSGWDQEEMDDNEITKESSRLLKEKKKEQREQRALEQLRRKQEKDALRHQKKITGQLGMKLN